MTITLVSAWYAAGASFLVCGLILATRDWHHLYSVDIPGGVQKFHTSPTPRIGGLGLMLGLIVGWAVPEENPVFVAADRLLGLAILASMPAFAMGLLEDFTKRVSVRARLMATFVSGLLVYYLSDYGIGELGIPPLDAMLQWAPFCALFTAFAVAGISNAYNIIDGFHGLSSSSMLVSISSLGAIAFIVGDTDLVYYASIYIGAILGFMIWNYPMGRLFMGDGGAYATGVLIAAMAIALPARNPAVSPWASLLACGYPVMETIFSMYRRWKNHMGVGVPDNMHLHSLIKRVIIRPRVRQLRDFIRNALVTLTLLPFMVIVAWTGVIFYDDTRILQASFVFLFLIYIITYRKLLKSDFSSCHNNSGAYCSVCGKFQSQ